AGINAAIDSLGAGGGEVWCPEAEYAIDSSIIFDYANTTLRGSGNGTYFNATTFNGNVVDCNGKTDLLIRDLKIRGSAGSGYTQSLIYEGVAITSYRVTVQNCYLYDSDGYGINFSSAEYSLNRDHKIIDNYVDGCDGAGIIVYKRRCSITTNTVFDCQGIHAGQFMVVNNNEVFNSTDRGIYAQTASNVVGNVVFNSQIHGIGTSGNSVVVTGNKVFECIAGHGFEIINADYGTISGNITQGNANNKVGFYIASTAYATINNNTDRSWAGKEDWGIYLDNSDYCTVEANVCLGHDNGGIYLGATSTNNHVVHNNLEGEAVVTIQNLGANNTVINAVAGVTTHYQELLMDTDKKFNLRDSAI
ncbi:hypothetical protein LCGC14_3019700, partial [marine sediment metagenome]